MSPSDQWPTPVGFRLNVFALPSYTAIIFGLIGLVILGTAFTALLPGSQLWWPPVVFGVTLLPLRDFLQWPDRLLRAYRKDRRCAKRNPEDDPNRSVIEAALAEIAPDRPPKLVITDVPVAVESFGTFRRRYVALGRNAAYRLANRLASPTRRKPYLAVLCHELAHFANHDMPLAQLSRSLLKMTVLVMTANIWIGLLLVAFAVTVSPDVQRPDFWTALSSRLASMAPGFPPLDLSWVPDSLRAQNPYAFEKLQDPMGRNAIWLSSSLYLLGAQLPFVLAGGVLWIFYWPRLMRIRELYADARAAQMLQDASAPLQALAWHGLLTLGPESQTPAVVQRLREVWHQMLSQMRSAPMRFPGIGPLLALHPDHETRQLCLTDPVQIFGKPHQIAVTVGLAVVLLDLATRGILTAAYIYEPGPYLPTLIIFAIVALWLVPQVCTSGRENRRGLLFSKIAQIIAIVTGMKLLIHLVDLGLVTVMQLSNAAGWGQALDLWVYAMLGVGAEGPLPDLMGVQVSWAKFIEMHVFRPMVYFGLALPFLFTVLLWADVLLKQWVLTWYGLDATVKRAFWGITGALGLTLLLVVIPLLNHLLFPEIYTGWSPGTLAGIAGALGLTLAGGLWFWRLDRCWAGRCPACGGRVSGRYYPGKRCPNKQCKQLLHPWLVASY